MSSCGYTSLFYFAYTHTALTATFIMYPEAHFLKVPLAFWARKAILGVQGLPKRFKFCWWYNGKLMKQVEVVCRLKAIPPFYRF